MVTLEVSNHREGTQVRHVLQRLPREASDIRKVHDVEAPSAAVRAGAARNEATSVGEVLLRGVAMDVQHDFWGVTEDGDPVLSDLNVRARLLERLPDRGDPDVVTAVEGMMACDIEGGRGAGGHRPSPPGGTARHREGGGGRVGGGAGARCRRCETKRSTRSPDASDFGR